MSYPRLLWRRISDRPSKGWIDIIMHNQNAHTNRVLKEGILAESSRSMQHGNDF
jgi:hypothetical protein